MKPKAPRRLLSTALMLALGYVALLVFLLALWRVFEDERKSALNELDARREVLAQYARVALSQRLHDRLAAAEPRIDAAVKDPLVDAEETLYEADGERLLPSSPAHPRPDAVLDDDEASEQPFVKALESAKNDAEVEKAVRGLLAHRARWKVAVLHDCEAVARVVEVLLPRASPQLLAGLLRDGFQGQDGLQRELLRARATLDAETLERWCARITDLSRRAGVQASDFAARCAQKPVARLEGDWYTETQGTVTRGIRYDRPAELDALAAQMTALGLLDARDELHGDPPQVTSWKLLRAGRRAQDLFEVKAGLLAVAAALGLSLFVLALVAQRRKLRFVEMKEDFVSAVSHELKTPLASMRVMAETLEHRLEGHAAAKDYPARLVAEVDNLHALVENILSFNRLDKGRWKPRLSAFLPASLKGALEDDARSWPSRVALSFTGFELPLKADAELLKLCLLNLLRNACRYNARDPIEVTFTFDGRVLRVRDNGVGIPEGDRARVFEDFVRLEPAPGAPRRTGTGLGLALCRRVMAMHGGSIEVESSGPDGTTFALRFV
jgi:signal transduction histidine kinase